MNVNLSSRILKLSGIVLFATAMLLMTGVSSQNALSQTTKNTDTFLAKGYMGNLALAPQTLQQLNASQDTNLNFIVGGNWSFDISKGQLKDFKVDLTRHSLGGHEIETHVIDGLKNATAYPPTNGSQIVLEGNHTAFKGVGDIKTIESNKVWKDVPITVYLINGHILNVAFDVTKTQGHFLNLPLFGVVTSLTDRANQTNSTTR